MLRRPTLRAVVGDAQPVATGTTEAAGPAPARPRRWWRGALVGVLVVALAAGGVAGFRSWRHQQDLQAQADAYATGHRAFLAADCAAAQTAFARADRPGLDDSVVATARTEREACRQYQALPGPGANPAQRLSELFAYARRTDPPAPLRAGAARTGQALLTGTPPADLAARVVCTSSDQLRGVGFVSAAQEGTVVPALLAACAAQSERTQDYDTALTQLTALRQRYPASPQAKAIGTAPLRLEVLQAEREGRPPLNRWSPDSRNGRSTATLAFYNDGNQEVRLVFHGPKTFVVVFPACPSCRKLGENQGCLRQGPRKDIAVPPGRYRVLYDAGKLGQRVGPMTFKAGEVYQRCFFVIA